MGDFKKGEWAAGEEVREGIMGQEGLTGEEVGGQGTGGSVGQNS